MFDDEHISSNSKVPGSNPGGDFSYCPGVHQLLKTASGGCPRDLATETACVAYGLLLSSISIRDT